MYNFINWKNLININFHFKNYFINKIHFILRINENFFSLTLPLSLPAYLFSGSHVIKNWKCMKASFRSFAGDSMRDIWKEYLEEFNFLSA